MAFGLEDTDVFFEELLKPVLRANDVIPVIINRRQSNDDLNAQIISQIELADFAVCDLTYARPSVYFEAGFAQRAVPVIYTVRADHLKRGQPDDLRVHFDLQMKPLVVWRTPQDRQFKQRFQARLRATVLREWKRQSAVNEALEQARTEFQHRSLEQRLVDARAAAIAQLRRQGFRDWEPGKKGQLFTVADVRAGRYNFSRSEQVLDTRTMITTVSSFETLTKDQLDWLTQLTLFPRSPEARAGRPCGSVETHHVVLVLRNVPSTRIDSAFRRFLRDPESGSYYIDEQEDERRHRTWWHFIAPITSQPEAASRVQRAISVALQSTPNSTLQPRPTSAM